MNLIRMMVVFGVCVVAFFVGVYFNKRDDERERVRKKLLKH